MRLVRWFLPLSPSSLPLLPFFLHSFQSHQKEYIVRGTDPYKTGYDEWIPGTLAPKEAKIEGSKI